jgi:hypothetical protein
VEDFAGCVFAEDTEAGSFFAWKFSLVIVVADLSIGYLVFGERDLEIEVEIGGVGRNPFEASAHTFFEGFDLRNWRARNGAEGNVASVQMRDAAVKMIAEE